LSIDVSTITLDRLIIHPFYEKVGAGPPPPPKKSTKLIKLDKDGSEALETRFRAVLNSNSKSIAVEIDNVEQGSVFQISASLLGSKDQDFIDRTYELAVLLKDAQDTKGVESGMVAVLTGTAGASHNRFVLILRAAAKPAFDLAESEGSADLRYLKTVVLGEDTKLYKIGFFLEVTQRQSEVRASTDFETLVFDHLISKGRNDKAAKYFYDTFLGCKQHKDSKSWGLQFYDETLNFIKSRAVSPDIQVAWERKLVDYAQGSNGDLNRADFATEAFASAPDAPQITQEFERYLKKKGVPDRSIVKDVDAMQARTAAHTVNLTSNVSIKLPRSVFMDTRFEITNVDGYTTIRIPGTVSVAEDES